MSVARTMLSSWATLTGGTDAGLAVHGAATLVEDVGGDDCCVAGGQARHSGAAIAMTQMRTMRFIGRSKGRENTIRRPRLWKPAWSGASGLVDRVDFLTPRSTYK